MSKEDLKIKKKIEKSDKTKDNKPFEVKWALSDFKDKLAIPSKNPIFAYLEKFDSYFKKKKRLLKAWEILFSPWIDSNLYIIKSGVLVIYGFTSDWEKKEIWKAHSGSIVWEWVIFWRNQKDVEAVSLWEAEIFSLNEEDLKKFEKENPSDAINIYKYVIELTNRRLLDSDKELASIYDATNKLDELAKLWEKWFMDIMIYIKWLLWADYIIFIENHPAINWFFYYKYNTKLPNIWAINKKAWDEINLDLNWIIDSKNIFWTLPDDNIFALPLKNWEKLKWYFMIWKQKWVITDNQIRIWSNLWHLMGSIIENNQLDSEKKALEMTKNVFDNNIS